MTTLAETCGEIPEIVPINANFHQFTPLPELIATGAETRPALYDCTCFACGHEWVSDGLAPECAKCGDGDIDCLLGTPECEGGLPVPATRFCIDSEDRANWFLRKLANLDAERRRIKAQASDILRGLDADETRLRARFEADLTEWAQQEVARRGKGKVIKLLQGVVAFRTVPAGIRITGTTEALNYAKAQGWDVVKVVESLDAAGYKQQAQAALAEDGELLPGVEVVPEKQSFSIKFKADKGEQADE